MCTPTSKPPLTLSPTSQGKRLAGRRPHVLGSERNHFCRPLYHTTLVDEYATLHIPFSVHASSMFIPGGVVGDARDGGETADTPSPKDITPKRPLFFLRRPASAGHPAGRCSIHFVAARMISSRVHGGERVTSLSAPSHHGRPR